MSLVAVVCLSVLCLWVCVWVCLWDCLWGCRWMYDVYSVSKETDSRDRRMTAPSTRDSLGRRTVCGRTEQRRPPVSKRYETKVRMVWGSFLIAAAAFKTPTRNGYNAQGVNLTTHTGFPVHRWRTTATVTSS